MATSHDGRLWQWATHAPLIGTGAFGRFDGGCIFWHPNLVELADGDFALPYTGYEFPHKYPRGAWSYRPGYAVWPKGRLAAIEAAEEGHFSTVSFFPPGRKLRINAVTQRAGEIRVAVTRRGGEFLPGRSFDDSVPIVGDQYRAPVRWKHTDVLNTDESEPIALRFQMTKGRIYFLEFE
jgi:hypothetical protein